MADLDTAISTKTSRQLRRRIRRSAKFPQPPDTPNKEVVSDDDVPPPPSTAPPEGRNEGSDVPEDSEWLYDDFMDAVDDNDHDGVQLLLDSIAAESRELLVNTADEDGFTALLHACTYENGHNLVKILLEYQAAVNYVAPDGSTALDCAVQDNVLPTIEILLNHPKINVNAGRCSSLFIAAQEGYTQTAKKLLRAKCRVDRRAYNGVTPMVMAIVQGYASIVKILLQAKASATTPSAAQGGRTPMMIAVERCDKPSVQHLVEAKADVNRSVKVMHGFVPMNDDAPKSNTDNTHMRVHIPIVRAAELGFTDMVEFLGDLGADTNARSPDGFTLAQLILENSRRQLEAIDAAEMAAAKLKPPSIPQKTPPSTPQKTQNGNGSLMNGYMMKGLGLKAKTRYFVLCRTKIVYFKSRDDYVACCGEGGVSTLHLYDGESSNPLVKGSLSLHGAAVENVNISEHRFEVFTCKKGAPKCYKFKCDDASTTKEWANLITQQCSQLRLESTDDKPSAKPRTPVTVGNL